MTTQQSEHVILAETSAKSGDPAAMEFLARRFLKVEVQLKVSRSLIIGQPLR